MPTADEYRAAMNLVASTAVSTSSKLLRGLDGTPEQIRKGLLDGIPEIVSYYSDGTASLGADSYEDERAQYVSGAYTANPVVKDRTVKIRRAVAWSADPIITEGDIDAAEARLAEVVQYETARPFRDTVLFNQAHDAKCIGWRRLASGAGCKFCRMLAAKGAVYREQTAHFASHPNCDCSAQPVFRGGEKGPEASVIQYMASGRVRSEKERAALRKYLSYMD